MGIILPGKLTSNDTEAHPFNDDFCVIQHTRASSHLMCYSVHCKIRIESTLLINMNKLFIYTKYEEQKKNYFMRD